MTFLDADAYHRPATRRRGWMLVTLFSLAGAVAFFTFLSWNWPAEHKVNQLFAAIEKQDLPRAFGIWNNDPGWQQHAQQYAAAGYPYGRFVRDWTDAEYGTITSHKILHATSRYGNNTLLVVEVNGRKTALMTVAVEKHGRTMNFSPFALTPVVTGLGWTDWQIDYR